MNLDTKIERGTLLEYRTKGASFVQTQEFWGVGHAERALDLFLKSTLRETTDHHKFTALERVVA
jgi:hypothetical protein